MPIDTGLWTTWGTGTEDEVAGALQQTPTGVSGEYTGVSSLNTYDFTNKTAVIQIAQLPNAFTGVQAYLRCEVDVDNGVIIGYSGDGNLFCQHQLAGVYTTVYATAFPGSLGLGLVFDNAQNLLWFATTLDGITWTSQFSETLPIATTALRVIIATGTYQAVGNPGFTRWESTGLPVVRYRNLTRTVNAAATVSATISRKKSIFPSTTYPCQGGAAAVGFLSKKSGRLVQPMQIRQIATGIVNAPNAEIFVPLQYPVAVNSLIYVVATYGPSPGGANFGGSIVLGTPGYYKQGVLQSNLSGYRNTINAPGATLRSVYAAAVQPLAHQVGVGGSVRFFTSQGYYGEMRVVVFELAGVTSGSSAIWAGNMSGTGGTSATPGVTAYTLAGDDTQFLVAVAVTQSNASGSTFTQVNTGAPWQRAFVETDGSTHMPFVVDYVLDWSVLGGLYPSGLVDSDWNIPASTGWAVFTDTVRGFAPSLIGLSAGAATETVSTINVSKLIVANPSNGTSSASGALFSLDPYALSIFNHPNNTAYWRLGETSGTTARDIKGGHNGTYTYGPTLNAAGAISGVSDGSVDFDGMDDYVEIPDFSPTPETYYGLVKRDTPQAYYRLDEPSGTSALDSSGNTKTGTFTGGTITRGQTGPLADGDTATRFQAGYVQAPLVTAFNNSAFTVEMWVKSNGVWTSGDKQLFSAGENGGAADSLVHCVIDGNQLPKLGFWFDDFGGIGPALSTDTWYHIAWVFEGPSTRMQRIYVNGVQRGSGRQATGTPVITTGARSGNGMQIGRVDGASVADITLDEVAIYPVALTPTQISDHYAARSNVGGFTAEAWVMFDSTASGAVIVERRNPSNVGGFILGVDNGGTSKALFYVYTDTWHLTLGTRVLSPGAWHHIVGVYINGQTLLMVNGEDNGRLSGIGSLNTPASARFRIGTDYDLNGSAFWNGKIDEVALYNTSLPDATIRDHYRLGIKQYDIYESRIQNTSGLVAYWPMNEGPYTGYPANTFDYSGNGHTLTDTNVYAPSIGLHGSASMTWYNGTSAKAVRPVVDSDLNFGAGEFTFEMWSYQDTLAGGPLLEYGDATNWNAHIWNWASTAPNDGVDNLFVNFGPVAMNGGRYLTAGFWHHIVVLRRGNTGYAYVDGVQRGTCDMTGLTPLFTLPINLKHRPLPTAYYGVGYLEDVAIYNRGLTVTEVLEHYYKGGGSPWKVDLTGSAGGTTTVTGPVVRTRRLTGSAYCPATVSGWNTVQTTLMDALPNPGGPVTDAQELNLGQEFFVTEPAMVRAVGVYCASGLPLNVGLYNTSGTRTGVGAGNSYVLGWNWMFLGPVPVAANEHFIVAYNVPANRQSYGTVGTLETGSTYSSPDANHVVRSGDASKQYGRYLYQTGLNYPSNLSNIWYGCAVQVLIQSGAPGPLTVKRALVAASTGTGVATALAPTRRRSLVAATAGVASASGVVDKQAQYRNVVGLTAGIATVSATITRKKAITGTSAGAATETVNVINIKRLVTGASPGVATVSATLTRRRSLVVTVAGTSVSAGQIVRKVLLPTVLSAGRATEVGQPLAQAGQIPFVVGAGKATVSAQIAVKRLLGIYATLSQSSVSGAVSNKRVINNFGSNGVAAELGQPSVRRLVSGTSLGKATATGQVNVKRLLGAGSSVGIAATTALAPARKKSIVALAAGSSTVVGQILIRTTNLDAHGVGTSTTSAAITRRRSVVAASAGTALTTASPTRKKALFATSVGVAVTAGAASHIRFLTASSAGRASVAIVTPVRKVAIVGSTAGVAFVPTAFLQRKRAVIGATAGLATTSVLRLNATRVLVASANGHTAVTGRATNVALVLWTGSTFTMAGTYPVLLWDNTAFQTFGAGLEAVAYKDSTDQFNPVPA